MPDDERAEPNRGAVPRRGGRLNTPTHAILGAALFARGDRGAFLTPVILGAVVPDTPMYALFAVATFVWRQPQARTWGETYFEPGWQHAVDALHSLPLLGAVLACTFLRLGGAPRWRGARLWVRAAVLSALLHATADLLVHVDDAHRHLWPLSDWQFVSPVSYWDPSHHGLVFAPLEFVGALALIPVVWRAARSRAARAALGVLAVVYGVGLVAATARLVRGGGAGPGSVQGAVTGRR